MASSVEKRIAFAFPFFKIDKFAIVIPTLSDSSVTLIFRFANMTSRFTIIGMPSTSNGQLIFLFDFNRLLQQLLQHRGEHSDDKRRKRHNQTDEDDSRSIVFLGEQVKQR